MRYLQLIFVNTVSAVSTKHWI